MYKRLPLSRGGKAREYAVKAGAGCRRDKEHSHTENITSDRQLVRMGRLELCH